MSYETIAVAFLILVFCFFTQIFVVKTMISLLNSARPEGIREIKTVELVKRKPKKTKTEREMEEKAAEERRQYETIMRNLEAYDGTGIGQEEVR